MSTSGLILPSHNEKTVDSLIMQKPTTPKLADGRSLHTTQEYQDNPHKAITDFVSPFLSDVKVASAKLLVATFRQPEKTKGGIILSSGYLEEDRFQGISGLVLKLGALCFEDGGNVKFGGFKAEPWQWVVYRPEIGRATELRGLHCRIIEDIHIDAVVSDPELLW